MPFSWKDILGMALAKDQAAFIDPDTGAENVQEAAIVSGQPEFPKSSQILPIDSYWAIDEGYANAVLAKLNSLDIIEATKLQAEYMAEQKAKDDAGAKPYEVAGSTAIIKLSGPMTKKETSASFLTGGTSTVRAMWAIDKAEQDASIKSILLHVDSPGGQVSGTAELGDKVKNSKKPVTAYIEDLGASAAYWVASQASKVYANRMAQIGSIGVYTAIEDRSAQAAMAGVKVHLINTGKYKGAGYPGTQITDAQLEDFQGRIDSIFGEFKSAVASGRGLSDDAVSKVADGRVFGAAEAASLGLIDGVMSLDDAFKNTEDDSIDDVRKISSRGMWLNADGTPKQFDGFTYDSTTGAYPPTPTTTAKASTAARSTMLDQFLARLKGAKPTDTLADLGIDPTTLGTPDPNAQLLADMEAMKNGVLNAHAESHWQKLITADANGKALANWSERDGIKATYMSLAALDGGVKLDATGQFIMGPHLKQFVESNLRRTPNHLQGSQIPDGDPRGGAASGIRTQLMSDSLKRLASSGKISKKTAEKAISNIEGSMN